MSCNGCRVLRRGCIESCVLRSCLQWIETPESQGNATLFLSKYFGRTNLMNFISAVPETNRPALFRSLLFEACGRTVNPISGAVGLLSTGNWHLCESAVQAVLAGETLQPSFAEVFINETSHLFASCVNNSVNKKGTTVASSDTEESEMVVSFGVIEQKQRCVEPKILNLFV